MSHADRIMILLVDDRPENLLAYQAILAELDLELVFARSGAEALKRDPRPRIRDHPARRQYAGHGWI